MASAGGAPASYWLLKAEPNPHMVKGRDMGSQPWALLAAKNELVYDGVRNYSARNNIRDKMRAGDHVLYYHSSCATPSVMGIAEVVRTYADPKAADPAWPFYDPKHTAAAPRWWSADLRPVRALKRPVTLAEIRAHGDGGGGGGAGGAPLAQMALLRQARLSVQPVTKEEWAFVVALEDEAAPAAAPPAKKKPAAAAAKQSAAKGAVQQQGGESAAAAAAAAAGPAVEHAAAAAAPAKKAAGKRAGAAAAAQDGSADAGDRAGKKRRA